MDSLAVHSADLSQKVLQRVEALAFDQVDNWLSQRLSHDVSQCNEWAALDDESVGWQVSGALVEEHWVAQHVDEVFWRCEASHLRGPFLFWH